MQTHNIQHTFLTESLTDEMNVRKESGEVRRTEIILPEEKRLKLT